MLDDRFVGLSRLPQLQTPALVRSPIDGAVGVAVQVELETRAMDDDMRRHVEHRLAGERVFLAQAFGVAERNRLCDLGAQVVPVMDRGRYDAARAILKSPRIPDGHRV